MAVQRFSRFRKKESLTSGFTTVKTGTLKKFKKSDGKLVTKADITVGVSLQSGQIQKTWDNKNPGPPFTQGGPFASILIDLPSAVVKPSGSHRSKASLFDSATFFYTFDGGFTNPDFSGDPNNVQTYLDLVPGSSDTSFVPNMDAYCAEVYNKLKPQIAKAGLGVALAEARDIPKMVKTSAGGFKNAFEALGGSIKSGSRMPKKLADHFINHQFGWRPFLKDLGQFYDVYDQSRKYIADIKRNNNTWVKRVRTIDKYDSEQVILRNYTPFGVEALGGQGVLPSGLNIADCFMNNKNINGNNVKGYHTLMEVVHTNVWAVGSFKFYRPIFDVEDNGDIASKIARLRQMLALYGAELNPSVIWHATPWTWLIDWFANVGTIIDNITEMLDNSMVARYMYLMHHHYREYRFTNVHHFDKGDVISIWSRFSEIKRRNEGPSPFNFCFGWDRLSPSQLAILAALGISRRG